MIDQNHYNMTQMTYRRQNIHDQVNILKTMYFHDHGLSPLPMQNPYSFFFAIKTICYLLTDSQKNCRFVLGVDGKKSHRKKSHGRKVTEKKSQEIKSQEKSHNYKRPRENTYISR